MVYQEKLERLARRMREVHTISGIRKETTNLFRVRERERALLDVRDFNSVLEVNVQEGWVETEAMITYEKLADVTLLHGVLPAVVPELKTITVGGAVSGTGLESSSFRFGFVHETVLEMDVLLADGRVVTARPDNEFKDLFFGIPNSYGTLGYILRAKIRTIPAERFVRLEHTMYTDAHKYFSAMEDACKRDDVDFVEGVVFSPQKFVLSTTQFVASTPYVSDYTYMKIYFKSLLQRSEDYLSTKEYLWRFDTDWFWRSDLFFAQNPLVRFLLGRKRLHSAFYMKVYRWYEQHRLLQRLFSLFSPPREKIVQDAEIPIHKAPRFLDFALRELRIVPIMIGPVRGGFANAVRFPLFPLDPNVLYVNVGVYGLRPRGKGPSHFNRRFEEMTKELGGIKMLYSDSYYSEQEFSEIYGGKAYQRLKHTYDPGGKFKSLYDTCVRRE